MPRPFIKFTELIMEKLTEQQLSLIKLYNFLSTQENFPFNFCQKAAVLAATHIEGLYAVCGKFRLDLPREEEGRFTTLTPHWWIEDSSQKIYELTGIQFNRWLKTPFDEGIIYLNSTHPNYSRYLRSTLQGSKFKPLSD